MGHILILSGPSGSGKSSLCDMLFRHINNYYFSISTTTRELRGKEENAKDYFFTSVSEFEKGIKDNLFLEWAKVHENYYGTSISQIQQALNDDKLVILDIDAQGMEQIIKKEIGNICTSVFINPPSKKELQNRLMQRNTDSPQVISKRINNASKEIGYIKNYDYLLINDNLQDTFENLMTIVSAMPFKVIPSRVSLLESKWD